MPKNVYIHIPFCKSKCKYCSFVSFPAVEKKQEYLSVLSNEIRHFYKNEQLDTLYFGGGTPSLLDVEDFKKLAELFNVSKDTEITAELNPDNLTEQYLASLRDIGINRISIGCQTFDDEILKLIGRNHSSKQVETSVYNAEKTGFENISLDFIYGLPNQTTDSFVKDLQKALSLGVSHISLYGLKIDKGCYFYDNRPQNLPDEDTQADMYIKAVELLKDFGHYEVSNFGKPSNHNLNYWNNGTYYGFGVAAHGYSNGIRYSNYETIEEYLNNPYKHKNQNVLTKQEKLEEEIFLGFRKMNGINVDEINRKFDINFYEIYSDILKKYDKYFVKTKSGYAFNIDGVLISNYILSEFLQ